MVLGSPPGDRDDEDAERLLQGELQWKGIKPSSRWAKVAESMVEQTLSPTPRYSVTQLTQALRRLTGLAITTTEGDVQHYAREALGHAVTKAKPRLYDGKGSEIVSLPTLLAQRLGRQSTFGNQAFAMTIEFATHGGQLAKAEPEKLGLLLLGRAMTPNRMVISTTGVRRILPTSLLRRELIDLLNTVLREGDAHRLDIVLRAMPDVQAALAECVQLMPEEAVVGIADLNDALGLMLVAFQQLDGLDWSSTRAEVWGALRLLDGSPMAEHATMMGERARRLATDILQGWESSQQVGDFVAGSLVTIAANALVNFAAAESRGTPDTVGTDEVALDAAIREYQAANTAVAEIRQAATALSRLIAVWPRVMGAIETLRNRQTGQAMGGAQLEPVVLCAVASWGRAAGDGQRMYLFSQASFTDLIETEGRRLLKGDPGLPTTKDGWTALARAARLLNDLRPLAPPDLASEYDNAIRRAQAIAMRVGIEIAADGRLPDYVKLAMPVLDKTTEWDAIPANRWAAAVLGLAACTGKVVADHGGVVTGSQVGAAALRLARVQGDEIVLYQPLALAILQTSLTAFAALAQDNAKAHYRVAFEDVTRTIDMYLAPHTPIDRRSIMDKMQSDADRLLSRYLYGDPDIDDLPLPMLPPLSDEIEGNRPDSGGLLF